MKYSKMDCLPEIDVALGDDGGGTRSSVDESEFSEWSAIGDGQNELRVDEHVHRLNRMNELMNLSVSL